MLTFDALAVYRRRPRHAPSFVVDRFPDVPHDMVDFIRARFDLSRDELSQILGVTPQTVSNWRGNPTPTAERTLKILYAALALAEKRAGAEEGQAA